MSTWLCDYVVDGDTINVHPNWNWSGHTGSRVRLAGVNAPELHQLGGPQARTKLVNLVQGRQVSLQNVENLSYERLVCDVFVNGQNVRDLL